MRRMPLGMIVVVSLHIIAGASAQQSPVPIVTLAQQQALELAALRMRYAQAIHALAEAELQAALDENRRWPGSISTVQLQRLQAVDQASRLSVRMAEFSRSPQETMKEMLRLTLAQRVSVQFRDIELSQFAAAVREKYQVNVRLDKKALDDAGLGEDTPLSIELQDSTLQAVLSVALKPFDLTFLVQDEFILITTIDEAGQKLETIVYDVYDLLVWNAVDRQHVAGEQDYELLMQLITGTVAPTTWDEVGGPSSIRPLLGMLVISQTQEVHAQISDLLLRLRKARLNRSDRSGVVRVLEAGQ